jgi:hypothetical protein
MVSKYFTLDDPTLGKQLVAGFSGHLPLQVFEEYVFLRTRYEQKPGSSGKVLRSRPVAVLKWIPNHKPDSTRFVGPPLEPMMAIKMALSHLTQAEALLLSPPVTQGVMT